jgi:peptidyl-prolyl cis-trans isomerase D
MLIALRDRITGIIAWLFVILISIPFMLWGVQEYFGVGESGYAVKVNGEKISNADFDQAMSRNRQALAQSFGGQIPAHFDANSFLRSQTLEELTNRELIGQLIDQHNYRVGATDLAETITQQSIFQTDGRFNSQIYEAELRSRGYSKQAYEQAQQLQLLAGQIQAGIQKTAFAPKQELKSFAMLRYQTRDFDFIRLPADKYKGDIRITDNMANEYYEEHKDVFMTEEQVSIQYIELDLQAMAKQVPVDEEQLRQTYDDAIAAGRYQSEEIRNARHILIRSDQDATPEQLDEKRVKIEELLARLKQGENFEELAKTASEDPGSAAQGGSLGEVRRGQMVKPFEDALFALPAGQLSEPVKTQFGFHIIKVDSIKPGVVAPFEEVRTALAEEYRTRQAESTFYDKVDMLATVSFENPDNLEASAEAIGASIQQSGLFTESNGDGIAKHSSVRVAAYSDPVLNQQRNSGLVEISNGHVVVLHLNEREPSRQQTLAEVRERVNADLMQRELRTRLLEAVDQLAWEMLETEDRAALARKYRGEYKLVQNAKRDNADVPREAVEIVFEIPAFEADRTSKGVDLGEDMAVVYLRAVKDGDLEWLDAGEKQRFQQEIVDARGRGDFSAAMAAVHSTAEILINPELQQ